MAKPGARRFIDELVARLRRAGPSGEMVMRFDSGFWSARTPSPPWVASMSATRWRCAPTNTKGIAVAIAAMDPEAWVDIDYTADGLAQVAECRYQGRRLIVRRTRLTSPAQGRVWPDWRHFGFLADLVGDVVLIDESTATTPPSSWPSGTSRRAPAWARAVGPFLGAAGGAMAVLLLAADAGPKVTSALSLFHLLGYTLLLVSIVLGRRALTMASTHGDN